MLKLLHYFSLFYAKAFQDSLTSVTVTFKKKIKKIAEVLFVSEQTQRFGYNPQQAVSKAYNTHLAQETYVNKYIHNIFIGYGNYVSCGTREEVCRFSKLT